MTDQTQGAVHLSAADFQQTIDTAGVPVVVDFFAEWCGPCKLAAPVIDKLSEEYKGKVVMAKLDVDENVDIARQFGVRSIPTVIVFQKEGEKVRELDRKIGFPGEDGYRQMIEQVIADAPAQAAA